MGLGEREGLYTTKALTPLTSLRASTTDVFSVQSLPGFSPWRLQVARKECRVSAAVDD